MTVSEWISKNSSWLLPIAIAIGGGFSWLFKEWQTSRTSKRLITDDIIDRLRTENADIKQIINEKNETINSQITIIASMNQEKNEMVKRIYKYQDSEIEMTKKISHLEQSIRDLTAKVEILQRMFPDLNK